MYRTLLTFLSCFGLLFSLATFTAAEEIPLKFPSIEQLAGTNYHYKIAFLWMSHIADGSLSLAKGEKTDTYRVRLRGETRGISAWLTSHRVQTYETLMQKQKSGRLITLTHDSTIMKGEGASKKIRTKHYIFDPEQNAITVSKLANGDIWWEKSIPFTGDVPVDILTAYFNLVTGVYGEISPGMTFIIPTFGGKKVGVINIEVLTDGQRPDMSFFPKDGILCRFTVDKEIFDTGDGTILVWYDDAGNPARGIIKDIIGLGDIRGTMR
jgi:hypothetical protein